MSKENSKNIYEEKICKSFLGIYNEYFRTNYIFIKSGEQWKVNEPDCVCSQELCIEITRGFYSEDLKREMDILENWWKVKFPRTGANLITTSSWINLPSSGSLEWPDSQAFNEVVSLIEEKNLKKYDWIESKKLLLLIDVNSFAITKIEDFEEYFKDFEWNNKTFIFNEVWIIDWNWIAKIYPNIL